jgi:periplasmic copper chaperone A
LTRAIRRLAAIVVLAGLAAGGCAAESGGIVLTDIRVGKPTGPNAGLYFTAANEGSPDRLVGAETGAAATVEIHETIIGSDGTMGMRASDGIDLGNGEIVELEPGGMHLMLVDVSPLSVGDIVEVTLIWEQAGPVSVEAEVVDPSDTMGDDG